MRFIKLALISLVVFAIILSAFSILLPSKINVSKAIDINAPTDSIISNIADLSNWHRWYADSSSAKISNPSTGKGASISFAKSTVTILSSGSNTIKAEWRTKDNTPMVGAFNIYKDSSDVITTVQWHFIQEVKWYPWEKFASIVSSKAIAPFMEKSLDKLKVQVETNR